MSTTTYAVCIKNTGYEASLELRKIYQVLTDHHAKKLGRLRVVDESGEDYLYPEDFFIDIQLPAAVASHFTAAA
jgi:archaellum component FlaG (FlaF/FlaG flagellin family)